jgi:hypothetical protein
MSILGQLGALWSWFKVRSGTTKTLVEIVAGFAVLLVFLSCFDLPIPGLPAESSAPAKVSYASSAVGGLALSVLAPPDHLISGESFSMEVLFTNSSLKPITIQASWMADCFSLSMARPLPIEVPASSSVLRTIAIRPVCSSGFHSIALYFRPVGAEPPFISTASIAPIQFVAAWRHVVFRFFFLVSAFLRALAIPAALAWLAYILNQKAEEIKAQRARQAEDFEEAQKERDSRLKAEQDDREYRGNILRLLLPEYSAFVQNHYLPISRRMNRIEQEVVKLLGNGIDPNEIATKRDELKAAIDSYDIQAKSDSSQGASAVNLDAALLVNGLWMLLFAILLYRQRLRSFLRKKGGIYFRSNEAEQLFSVLLNEFFPEIEMHLGKERMSAAMGWLDLADEPETAAMKWGPAAQSQANVAPTEMPGGDKEKEEREKAEMKWKRAEFSLLHESLKQWIITEPSHFRAYTRMVQLSSTILGFECNRPFYQTDPVEPNAASNPANPAGNPVAPERNSGWYFDAPQIRLKAEMYEIPQTLRASLYPKIVEYLDRIPLKCKVNSPIPNSPAAGEQENAPATQKRP